MTGRNEISLSLEGNEDLQSLFAGKNPGESVNLGRVTAMVKEITADQAVLTVTQVEPEDDETEPAASEDDPKDGAPVLVMVGGKKANPLIGDE